MNRGVRTKRKERAVLVVVERSRLGARCLAEAYEQVVPIVQCSRGRPQQGTRAVKAPEQRILPGGTP